MRNAIKTVISNATKSYIDIATTDPVVESQEDGTSRGDFLDLVIKEQKKENKRLWDKLYQVSPLESCIIFNHTGELEQQQKEAGKHRVFLPEAEYTTADRKMLSALMYEHRDLSTQITTEMSKVEMFDVPDDTILEVMFRERIEKEIQQYKMTIEFVKEQLSQAKHYLKEEQATLKDTETLHAGLKKEKQRLAHEIRFKLTKEHLREDRVRLEEMIKRDQNDFIDFLDEFYPPHQVDVGNAMNTFKCDLKKVIEELMNKAVNSPDNPYVTLVPGTYWPPYIQTLIQAQVAQYDPQDANRIRLYDFKP